jgi:hypothetical protein
MITALAQLHPHTEEPASYTNALIAVYPDADDADNFPYLLAGMFFWEPSYGWKAESSGLPLKHKEFWWITEADLLAPIITAQKAAA